MDCFYDSDEEVAWGPLSLREIKKEILEHSRKINRRETDFGQCTFYSASGSLSEDKIQEANATGTSAYFTPDESLAPDEIPNRNEKFLEKMSQVIEDEAQNLESSFSMTADTSKTKNDTLFNILQLEEGKDCNLEDIHQTLVDNTVCAPVKEKISEVVAIDSTIEELSDEESYIESENDEIITISDESTLDVQVPYESPKVLIKTEKGLSESLSSEHSTESIEDESSTESQEEKADEIGELSIVDDKVENEEQKLQDTSFDEEEINISGLGPLLSEMPSWKRQSNSSSAQASSEYSSRVDSPVFNDTMEEMEMALKQGLDYVMPGEDDLIPRSPMILKNTTNQLQVQPMKKKLLKTPKFDYIQSPVGDYIRKKSPPNFKLPMKTVKKKPQTPNPKSPSVATKHFKDIISPIGIYIKNSPRVCIKQNVVAKTVPQLQQSPASHEMLRSNKENCCQFPGVVYKPGKKIVTAAKEITLPSSIKKMIPETGITNHTVKIHRNHNVNKLLEFGDGDLTAIDSSLLNQSENVSFVKTTQAFIK